MRARRKPKPSDPRLVKDWQQWARDALIWMHGMELSLTKEVADLRATDNGLARRTDILDASTFYRGEAEAGASESQTVWRICKGIYDSNGRLTLLWANGTQNFGHAWTDRATYSYS
jgi:hypothetical protein